MADGKQWFKVLTSILTDPALSFLHNQTVGVWLRLCALTAQHGDSGKITIPTQQLLVTLHLSNATQNEINKIFNEIKTLHITCNEEVQKDSVTLVTLQFLNWQKYQAYSESYERVNKFRKSKSERYKCNVEKKRREEKRREEKRKEESIIENTALFLTKLKENSAYKGIDIDKELSKMDAWFLTPKGRGRKKTKAFIVNWLNKIDVEIGGQCGHSRSTETVGSKEGSIEGNKGKYAHRIKVLDADGHEEGENRGS